MHFLELVELVLAKAPLQRKRLAAFLAGRDRAFFDAADLFCGRYGALLEARGLSMAFAVDAYVAMCSGMLRGQIDFMRSGKYPVITSADANRAVYASEQDMLPYMVSLAMSQFLWPTHHAIFNFFDAALVERAPGLRRYLEVGPGHGLFLEKALTRATALERAVALDISQTSLDLTRSVIGHYYPAAAKLDYVHGDFLTHPLAGPFDFVTMGEVLEHVEDPAVFLQRGLALLAPGGAVFLSTCANCPAVDHVYQFNSVAEIRALIRQGRGTVLRELAIAAEDVTLDEAESRRITINYCAMVN
jgi:2-polyprenyl-3-methyl-5-hydroxy-6-metoxy-1,4-benzoquinol methylase